MSGKQETEKVVFNKKCDGVDAKGKDRTFESGETAELSLASAERWVRRGHAERLAVIEAADKKAADKKAADRKAADKKK